MFGRSFVVSLVLMASSPTRADPMPNPVVASGYRESAGDRPMVAAAIKVANAVLRVGSGRALAASWEAPADRGPGDPIRVYLVGPSGDEFMIESPFRSCNCIFLQTSALRSNLARYSTKLKSMMRIEPRDMLGFMLLHEVGHIVHNDLGSFDKGEPDYNFEPTEQKKRETAADRFAADALTAATDQKKDGDAFRAAWGMELALTNASWNLSALRLIDGFGGSVLCSKALFADRGGTHPNFELRILTVNDILANTSTSKELLESFEKCRTLSDGVLYRR